MKSKIFPLFMSVLVSVSSMLRAQDADAKVPLSTLAKPAEIEEVAMPTIKTESEKIAEAEAARKKAAADAEAARIKAKADSEVDAESKIELAKLTASEAKVAEQRLLESEAEAVIAEAKAKELRALALEDAKLAKKAMEDNVTALADAEKAITIAKNAGSTLFDNVIVSSDKEEDTKGMVAEGAMTIAESITNEKYEEVFKTYKVEKGGSLSLISVQAYERPGYWRILKLHNGISPEKLRLGQVVNAPDLRWLLDDSGLSKMFPIACRDLMRSRKIYMEVEDDLVAMSEKDSEVTNDQIIEKLVKSIQLVSSARSLILKRKSGVKGAPTAAATQLLTACERMQAVAKGKRTFAAKNIVHEHISNAIVYSVLWARDGFK